MPDDTAFDLADFMPYLLNRAAERQSLAFQTYYKDKYGMLRTEWRVLFHLGRYGTMTAKQVCDRATIHKTKVSRAVAALSDKRFLTRRPLDTDRRVENLSLTALGRTAFGDLVAQAQRFDQSLLASFTTAEAQLLRRCLTRLATL